MKKNVLILHICLSLWYIHNRAASKLLSDHTKWTEVQVTNNLCLIHITVCTVAIY